MLVMPTPSFFHMLANHRRRNNHIATLQVNGTTLMVEDDKANAAFNYFFDIFGTSHDREGLLDFEALWIPR